MYSSCLFSLLCWRTYVVVGCKVTLDMAIMKHDQLTGMTNHVPDQPARSVCLLFESEPSHVAICCFGDTLPDKKKQNVKKKKKKSIKNEKKKSFMLQCVISL